MDNINKIAESKVNHMDKPVKEVKIKTMTVDTFGVEYPEPDKN